MLNHSNSICLAYLQVELDGSLFELDDRIRHIFYETVAPETQKYLFINILSVK